MGRDTALNPEATAQSAPEIRDISSADLWIALRRGYKDFLAKPSFVFFLAIIYPVISLILIRFIGGYDVLPYLWPLIAGGTIVAPIAALGLYEVSRLMEGDQSVSLRNAFNLFNFRSLQCVATLSLLLGAAWVMWLYAANIIYVSTMGDYVPASVPDFIQRVFFTDEGKSLIMVGSAVGFAFALVIFMISVVSFPMIIDRDVSAMEAISTSVRVVLQNPWTMLAWAMIISFSMALAAVSFMFGLALVLPILGHASWHLYRRVVGE